MARGSLRRREERVKYLLILFFLTDSSWMAQGRISSSQHGPYDNILACEKAARQAEVMVKELGAAQVVSFCSSTKSPDYKQKG
jgi:hypothetical protein